MENLSTIRQEFYSEDLNDLKDIHSKFLKLSENLIQELKQNSRLTKLFVFKVALFIQYSEVLRNAKYI